MTVELFHAVRYNAEEVNSSTVNTLKCTQEHSRKQYLCYC